MLLLGSPEKILLEFRPELIGVGGRELVLRVHLDLLRCISYLAQVPVCEQFVRLGHRLGLALSALARALPPLAGGLS